MKWVIDTTGRFRWRPYYEQKELDNECERIVAGFLREKNGIVRFPLSTDDLTIMLERETSDLNLFADLSRDGDNVEGVTDFFPHRKPAVRIARELSLYRGRDHRLRTTLAHEYGHVRFHTFLWNLCGAERPFTMAKTLIRQYHRYQRIRQAFEDKRNLKFGVCFSCKRDHIFDAPFSDWMEWQASYICGAVLMPVSLVRKVVRKSLSKWERQNIIPSDYAMELITGAAAEFDVSNDAARARLVKLGFLPNNP